MFILSGDLKGFTNAILFQFLMLILPLTDRHHDPHFPHGEIIQG